MDESVVLFYFSKSKDTYPGKGTNEQIPNDKKELYEPLSKIKDWRKMLSNFYIAPFTFDGLTWNTVEHYYQGSKFKKNNNEFYREFSIESGSDISKDPVLAKGAGGKTGKSKGKQVRLKNIVIDDDFFSTDRHWTEMESAIYAKFSQNKNLKEMLLLTNNAVLTHGTRGTPITKTIGLMNTRFRLGEN